MQQLDSIVEFTLFYDGQCPICRKEVAFLSRCNKHGRLVLQDIHSAGFNAEDYGKKTAELMAEIHGLLPDGRIIKGMPVFRAAYRAVGLGWLMAPTGWPVINLIFDGLYVLFAKYRLSLGVLFGRTNCPDGVCSSNKIK
ncbi:DUF393 domain-containing protein [Methylosoma difficile]